MNATPKWAFRGPQRSADDTAKTLQLTTSLWEYGDETSFIEDREKKIAKAANLNQTKR
jgi:hypothetical protein